MEEEPGVLLASRRLLGDPRRLQRLRVGGLVLLVVAEAAVADQVDQRVAAEALAERGGQPHGRDAGLHVVGVHVDDRDVEALGEVRGIAGRAAVARIRGEAELVVRDDVERASGAVAVEGLQVQRLRHHALAREGGVAVDQHGHHHRRVVNRLATLAARLVGARAALDHRVDDFQMARIRGESDRDPLAAGELVGARRAVVVLHVAGAALGHRGIGLEVLLALEFHEDRLVRAAHRVRQHVEATAVRHAENHLARAGSGRARHRLVEHRHEHVHALDRELLLAEERLVQVALQRLHLREPLEQLPLLLR